MTMPCHDARRLPSVARRADDPQVAHEIPAHRVRELVVDQQLRVIRVNVARSIAPTHGLLAAPCPGGKKQQRDTWILRVGAQSLIAAGATGATENLCRVPFRRCRLPPGSDVESEIPVSRRADAIRRWQRAHHRQSLTETHRTCKGGGAL